MPTGSLCAERNVIGTALADNLSLRRHDLKHIAVLSLSFDDDAVGQNLETGTSLFTDEEDCGYGNFNGDEENSGTEIRLTSPQLSAILSADSTDVATDSISLTRSTSEPVPGSSLIPPPSPRRVVKITSLKGEKNIQKRARRNSGKSRHSMHNEHTPIRTMASFSSLHEPPTHRAIMVNDR